MRNHLETVKESIQNENVPVINLYLLIDSINRLINLTKTKTNIMTMPSGEISLPAVITTVSHKLPPIPMKLKSNKQLIITTKDFDLSPFKREELIEILEILDVTTSNTPAFDDLKSAITTKLSSM